MSDVTVRQFANDVGIPLDRLMTQLSDVGVSIKDADATISVDEKLRLLEYLRTKHGKGDVLALAEPKKITLKRKTVSELRQTGTQGKSVKTISVEVRKKRTYVKRSVVLAEEAARREVEKALEAQKEAEELMQKPGRTNERMKIKPRLNPNTFARFSFFIFAEPHSLFDACCFKHKKHSCLIDADSYYSIIVFRYCKHIISFAALCRWTHLLF